MCGGVRCAPPVFRLFCLPSEPIFIYSIVNCTTFQEGRFGQTGVSRHYVAVFLNLLYCVVYYGGRNKRLHSAAALERMNGTAWLST